MQINFNKKFTKVALCAVSALEQKRLNLNK